MQTPRATVRDWYLSTLFSRSSPPLQEPLQTSFPLITVSHEILTPQIDIQYLHRYTGYLSFLYKQTKNQPPPQEHRVAICPCRSLSALLCPEKQASVHCSNGLPCPLASARGWPMGNTSRRWEGKGLAVVVVFSPTAQRVRGRGRGGDFFQPQPGVALLGCSL